MRIVDGRICGVVSSYVNSSEIWILTQRDRSRRTHIRIALFVNHAMQLVCAQSSLVEQDVIVHWPGSALDGRVRTEIYKNCQRHANLSVVSHSQKSFSKG